MTFESAVELAGLTFAANTSDDLVIGFSFEGGGVILTDPGDEHPPCLTATPTLGPTTLPSMAPAPTAPTRSGEAFSPSRGPITAPSENPTAGPTRTPSADPSSRPSAAPATTVPTRPGETFSPSPSPTQLPLLPSSSSVPPTAAPILADGDMEVTLTIVDKDLNTMSTVQRGGLKAKIVDRYCTLSFSAEHKAPCVTNTAVGLSPGSIVATVVTPRSAETLAGAQAMLSAADGTGLFFTVEGTVYTVGSVTIYSITAGLSRSPTLATATGQVEESGSNQNADGTGGTIIALVVLALIGLLLLLLYVVHRKKAGARGNAISPAPQLVDIEPGSAWPTDFSASRLVDALRSAEAQSSGSKIRVAPAEEFPPLVPSLPSGGSQDNSPSAFTQHLRRETIPFQSSAAAPKAPGARNGTVVLTNTGGGTTTQT